MEEHDPRLGEPAVVPECADALVVGIEQNGLFGGIDARGNRGKSIARGGAERSTAACLPGELLVGGVLNELDGQFAEALRGVMLTLYVVELFELLPALSGAVAEWAPHAV